MRPRRPPTLSQHACLFPLLCILQLELTVDHQVREWRRPSELYDADAVEWVMVSPQRSGKVPQEHALTESEKGILRAKKLTIKTRLVVCYDRR